MNKDYLVTKSNYFIMNSSYDLSLEEQKIILTLASMVQPVDEEFKPYKFRINDFMELLGVDTKTKYTEIPKITKELMKKVLEIQEGNTLLQVAWLNSVRYEKGSGMVTLKFSPDLKPYMLQLKEKFTQYQLANVLSMKSKYAPRIYEILKCNEFKKQGYIEIEIDELRKLLKINNMYPQYNDFKRKIILQAQKELKKLSDVNFEFEEIKTGRKITSLKFYIHANKSTVIKEPIAVITNVDDEVSATIEVPKEMNKETGTREVLKILKGNEVNPMDALEIYNNAGGDINHIEKVYKYSKTQNVNNIIGFMKDMVKPGKLKENIKISKSSTFIDYSQRKYDFDDLEKKLLGWDEEEIDPTGKEFRQVKMNVE